MSSLTSTMSDDESFVILGSSPIPSLSMGTNFETQQLEPVLVPGEEADSPGNSCSSMMSNMLHKLESAKVEEQSKVLETSVSAESTTPITAAPMTKSATSTATSAKPNINQTGSDSMGRSVGSGSGMVNSVRSTRSNGSSGGDASLAASFIMGDINADVLKTSVYSQFPSLCSMEACAEDVVKLQNLMSEHLELKSTLAKVNMTIKQFHIKTQQWHEDAERMEQQYNQQLQDCQTQIAVLRNENLELRREVNEKIDQMKLYDNLIQKDYAGLRQDISLKTEQINNMRVHIQKLEQHQLASYEYVPRHEDDSKDKPDYVDRLEHERMVKDLQRQLSQLLAENLETKDMEKQYIDEINCLKVNLTAAEELIKQSRADINVLKAKDIEKTETFTNYESERDRMREEISLLQQQVDIYSKDFEMERAARQNAAGEKDQLLQDLRALQRRNQELIEEMDKRANSRNISTTKSTPSPSFNAAAVAAANFDALPSSSSSAKAVPPKYCCPVCSKEFSVLTVLEGHINDCLDKN